MRLWTKSATISSAEIDSARINAALINSFRVISISRFWQGSSLYLKLFTFYSCFKLYANSTVSGCLPNFRYGLPWLFLVFPDSLLTLFYSFPRIDPLKLRKFWNLLTILYFFYDLYKRFAVLINVSLTFHLNSLIRGGGQILSPNIK